MSGKDAEVESLDIETGQRNIKGNAKRFIFFLLVVFSLFQIWANSIGLITSMKHLGVFLAFTLCLIFLLYPAKKGMENLRWYDVVLAIFGFIVGIYIVFRIDSLLQSNLKTIQLDYVMAGLSIILVLEATRRVIGMWLVSLPIIFIAYALFGNYIPGVFGHYGFTLERLLTRMYLLDGGMFGVTMRVAATYIFMFVLFGAFLEKSGVGDFFTRLALSLSGGSTGGPAKVAVFSSSLMGTISGSAVANVATTGPFTIPLMKRIGYKPKFAAAVEAGASTGGLIAPPIMGSAAFVMAEILGMNYSIIMVAAIIPALLYYAAIYFMVHFEAKKLGLEGLPKDELPRLKEVLKQAHLLLPLIIIIYTILIGKTPLYAAMLGIISTIAVSFVSKQTRIGWKKFFLALEQGAKQALGVSIACIVAGIIVGVSTMTGLGQVVAYNIILFSNNTLFIALLLMSITTIFLSMALPATAAYIIVASVAAPALVVMGVPPLAAHFFVFYFSCLSNLTPPVALAAYTAASLSGSKPNEVAWLALRLTTAGFIVPFMFVYAPELLLIDTVMPNIILAFITATIGAFALAVSIIGYLKVPLAILERILYFASALLLIKPGLLTDAIGIVILISLIIFNYKKRGQNLNDGYLIREQNKKQTRSA